MFVVFCTYQSLDQVAAAQQNQSIPDFDLVICDEAHRTTGVEKDKTSATNLSNFLLVHDEARIRATRRLYTTATPRIYTAQAKSRADLNADVYSMDDPAQYGPEFYRMDFASAVSGGHLADYKVVILRLTDRSIGRALENVLAAERATGINLEDAVKLCGVWNALTQPEGPLAERQDLHGHGISVLRALNFANSIKESKRIAAVWPKLIASIRQSEDEPIASRWRCEVDHVDGTTRSLQRMQKLAWLKRDGEKACRVLSNARCLTEGVDVPALDAVIFFSPRKSQIDVVQAVGRVMRKVLGKELGYVILPVVIPEGMPPEQVLNDNSVFGVVWSVLRALRSHDSRLDVEINTLDLNQKKPNRILFVDSEGRSIDEVAHPSLEYEYEIQPNAIYGAIVEKCGDRKYWPSWANDIAKIAQRIRERITGLIHGMSDLQGMFQNLKHDLQRTLHDQLQESDILAMLAQHLVAQPVFQALFADYDFARLNPVSKALDAFVALLDLHGLENETRDLDGFYDSVRQRAQTLDNPQARQTVLLELYDKFFRHALPKEAERLGIVYTPVEVVDFLLQSAEDVLRQTFRKGLTDADVHILDPFTGTGTFLARMLQNPNLIQEADLTRKFRSELHANEIVLLAYYIAAVNIEEVYHGRRGMNSDYEPFAGIVLQDTFNSDLAAEGLYPFMARNHERARRQKDHPLTVIVGNPPYSAGQKTADDYNANISYPELERRVRETSVAKTKELMQLTNLNSCYDSYKMALRWASDRIGEQGVIALVTPATFIDAASSAGLRWHLANEFSKVYIFNLRGNQRTQGERSQKEGGKIFGSGSRTPIALSVLVRAPSHQGPCQIYYLDIGDYLDRQAKLNRVAKLGSVAGITELGLWEPIEPDARAYWLDKPNPAFQTFLPLGAKSEKGKSNPRVAARTYSSGIKTGRDAWVYDFSQAALAERMQAMTAKYEETQRYLDGRTVTSGDQLPAHFRTGIKWDSDLLDNLKRRPGRYSKEAIRTALYRPFVKMYLYFDPVYMQRSYQISSLFPAPGIPNLTICVSGLGEAFSILITDALPDLSIVAADQCFPRWTYHVLDRSRQWANTGNSTFEGYCRVDNITDWCLAYFQSHYTGLTITKDDIWHYIYGVLHAPDYRKAFAFDLTASLPRIPLAPDFKAFALAGEKLSDLHLHYETCTAYPLDASYITKDSDSVYRLSASKMKWNADRTELCVTDNLILRGIPSEAHIYSINGRTPLEWAVDRLRLTQDSRTGIIKDPNEWFADDPKELVRHLCRLTYVSVETSRIMQSLPPAV